MTAAALRVDTVRPNRDVYEFDLTMWHLLKRLALSAPQAAHDHFGLTEAQLEAIAQTPTEQIHLLASGVLFSFALATPLVEVRAALAREYDPVHMLRHEQNDLDAGYWLLVSRIAATDGVAWAAQTFHLDVGFVNEIQNATTMQLRALAYVTRTQFALRFTPPTLQALLTEDSDRQLLLRQKIQQSLTH